jgi:hypothetical protein
MPYNVLETIELNSWHAAPPIEIQKSAINALENGQVIFIPILQFNLNPDETKFLNPDICSTKAKNVSYDVNSDKLGGTIVSEEHTHSLKALMRRYAEHSKHLLHNLFPNYSQHARQGRTSFRPVEIAGRVAPSYRKDDTLLHVDAFPATPVKGERILRVFTNVNPNGQARVWHVGETLPQVVSRFATQIKDPLPGIAHLQRLLRITRGYRTKYDHYMLNIHHLMKADQHYQKNVSKQEIHFPPGSTWFVYTDQVSHAALSGQHVFEQTFYLPVHALKNEHTSPLRVLERFLDKRLL